MLGDCLNDLGSSRCATASHVSQRQILIILSADFVASKRPSCESETLAIA
jgi:hypothetical protein